MTEVGADEAAAAKIGETDLDGAASVIDGETERAENADPGEAALLSREVSSLLYVHVCGAVEVPGVYELPAGSRVYEAVQAAGGFAENAERNYVNQAQTLADGVKLVIPTVEEAAAADRKEQDFGAAAEKSAAASQIGIIGDGEASGEETAQRTEGRININTATKQELCGIPGVGETRAAAIVSYRESHGGFARPEDIMKVSGIKEGMYDKIKESICVD